FPCPDATHFRRFPLPGRRPFPAASAPRDPTLHVRLPGFLGPTSRVACPAAPRGRRAGDLLRRPGGLPVAGAGRGALYRDPARDAGERRLRHAASERRPLLRETSPLLLAERGGPDSAGATGNPQPARRGILRSGGNRARLGA